MMNSRYQIKPGLCGIILVILFVVSGCFQDIIDVDTSEIENQLVIEGKITNELQRHTIKIHSASRFSDPYDFESVTGALVSVSVSNGNVIEFPEIEPGIYKSEELAGIPGETYSLRVISGDKVYESSSFMPEPVGIDSARFFPYDGMRRYEFKYYFTDKVDTTIFCRIDPYINNMHLQDEVFMFNGKYSDGKSYVRDEIFGSNLYYDLVTIVVASMDETSFEIYSRMDSRDDYVSEDGEIDAGTLLDMSSFNFSNISNGAIGFFSAQSIIEYKFSYNTSDGKY